MLIGNRQSVIEHSFLCHNLHRMLPNTAEIYFFSIDWSLRARIEIGKKSIDIGCRCVKRTNGGVVIKRGRRQKRLIIAQAFQLSLDLLIFSKAAL